MTFQIQTHNPTHLVHQLPPRPPQHRNSIIPYKTRKNQIIPIKLIHHLFTSSIPINLPIPSPLPNIIHKSTISPKFTLTLTISMTMRNEFRNTHSSRSKSLDNSRDNFSSSSSGKHITWNICFK